MKKPIRLKYTSRPLQIDPDRHLSFKCEDAPDLVLDISPINMSQTLAVCPQNPYFKIIISLKKS